jgi:hypothetical protein
VCRTLFHISSGDRQNCEKKSFQSVTNPYTSVLNARAAAANRNVVHLVQHPGLLLTRPLGHRFRRILSTAGLRLGWRRLLGAHRRFERRHGDAQTPSLSSKPSSGALALV